MYMYIHTCTRTTHTHMHTYHTHTHAHVPHTCTCTTHTHAHVPHTHTCTRTTHMHTYHTHTHTYTTHTHTCTRTTHIPHTPRTGVVEVSRLFEDQSITPDLKDKYIQLLEKFEVAFKVNQRYLIVPSMMRTDCPSMIAASDTILPSSNRDYRFYQPPLRRFWLSTFVPQNYWHHLFCRVAADQHIEGLVPRDKGVGEDSEGLNWLFWATGMAYTLRGRTLLIIKQQRNEEAYHGEEFRIEVHIYTLEWAALSNELQGKDRANVLPLATNLLVMLSQHVVFLALEWFPGMLLGHPKPSAYVPCWKCYEALDCTTIAEGDSPVGDDIIYHNHAMVHCFEVDKCVTPAVLGRELMCVFHNGLEVVDMVPDLVSVWEQVLVMYQIDMFSQILTACRFFATCSAHRRCPIVS